MTHAPETGPRHKSTPFSAAGFQPQFFVPYASGMKISGAGNKRIKVILYSVYSTVHCTGQTIKISINGLCLLCTFVQCFLVVCTPLSGLE